MELYNKEIKSCLNCILLLFQRIKVHQKLKRQSIGGNSTATPGDTGFTAAAIAAAKRQSGGKANL